MDLQDKERAKIRENISNLSFEELIKLKEDIGAKTYNNTFFGTSKLSKNKNFKRANKNRPREISSKVRVQKLKQELQNNVPVLHKAVTRDPRFDPLCGQFEEKTFNTNYSFLNDIRLKEKQELENELKSCTDTNKKSVIKSLLQRMNNKLTEQDRKHKEEVKKLKKVAEIKEHLKQGKRPIFKKKSVEKLENLIDKYEELKKSNKIHKHIEKRTKKIAQKEKKKQRVQ